MGSEVLQWADCGDRDEEVRKWTGNMKICIHVTVRDMDILGIDTKITSLFWAGLVHSIPRAGSLLVSCI